jgi:hypothetical protein
MSIDLKNIIYDLEAQGVPHFFTGSRCWGVHNPDSDYDLCIHFDDYDTVKRIISDQMRKLKKPEPYITYQGFDILEITLNEELVDASCDLTDSDFQHSSYGAGVKIDIGGDHLNLIRLLEGDFIFWLFATNAMLNIYKINSAQILNKALRHSVFETLRAIAKATITYDGWKLADDKLLETIKDFGG